MLEPSKSNNRKFNPWGLFTSIRRWQDIEQCLDVETKLAFCQLDQAIKEQISYVEAAENAFQAVLIVLDQPENARYGSSDTEPRLYLAELIQAYLKNKYRVNVQVDHYGCAIQL